MEYRIDIRNNWWFDAGIVGLYFIASDISKKGVHNNIRLNFDENSLFISGDKKESIKLFLEDCYKELANLYWNVSIKSQKEKKELVMYDKEKDEFYLASKRGPTPVVQCFVKQMKAKGVEYKNIDNSLKIRLDRYLKDNNKLLWGKKKKLLYTLPECQPNIKILPKENTKRQASCSICGKQTSNLNIISQPAFLLFASDNAATSFHTQGKKPAKLCWECEMISKFTMHTINYKKEGKNISILVLNSPNLKLNIDNQKEIGCSSVLRGFDSEYFYKNIGFDENGITRYASFPYELLWAYFVDTYSILKNGMNLEDSENDFFKELLDKALYSPVEIIILSLVRTQNTFTTKELIFYNDICYVYRLINKLSEENDLNKIFSYLLERDRNGNKLPTRNIIFKNILNKHCILSGILAISERKVFSNANINVSSVLKFLIQYYLIIKEDGMNKEQIQTAVNLGKTIVKDAYFLGKDKKEKHEIIKKIRGDLYSLRKTRTITDFITQINTLQFRYGITVAKEILEGSINDVTFEDFKCYCIMGALNNYNYYMKENKEGK